MKVFRAILWSCVSQNLTRIMTQKQIPRTEILIDLFSLVRTNEQIAQIIHVLEANSHQQLSHKLPSNFQKFPSSSLDK